MKEWLNDNYDYSDLGIGYLVDIFTKIKKAMHVCHFKEKNEQDLLLMINFELSG